MDIFSIDVVSLPVIAGILAAFAHVLAGPDHLAAVMPLAVENNKKSWRIGMAWGAGHIGGMLLIGVLFIAFKQFINVELISEYSEVLVGVVLIFIGLWAFYRIFVSHQHHKHVHIHQEEVPYIHSHHHDHEEGHHEHHHDKKTKKGMLSAFLVGCLHGFAGISHFLVLLPVLGLQTTSQSAKYMIGFAIGTLLSMTLFALVTGKVASKSMVGHKSVFFIGLRLAAGSFALLIGIFWIIYSL